MKRVTIPASPDHADRKKRFALEVAIVLGDEIEAKYEVVAKDFPEDLPDFWVDPDDEKKKEIHWLSNFGLLKPDGTFEARLPKGHRYQVEIPIPSSASGKAAKAAGAGAAPSGGTPSIIPVWLICLLAGIGTLLMPGDNSRLHESFTRNVALSSCPIGSLAANTDRRNHVSNFDHPHQAHGSRCLIRHLVRRDGGTARGSAGHTDRSRRSRALCRCGSRNRGVGRVSGHTHRG